MARTIALLAAPLLASAQLTNLTIGFFPSSKQEECESGDVGEAITLTTESIPRAYTCFNTADLFSSNQNVGFQNDTYGDRLQDGPNIDRDPDLTAPRGVAYLLDNADTYDGSANYTNVWYRNVNDTGTIGDGEISRWVIYTYAFDDCEQVGGDDFKTEDYPWFEASCQTSPDGQCQSLTQPIKSFAIGPAAEYDKEGTCAAWAEMGTAPRIVPRASALAALAAGVAAYMLVL